MLRRATISSILTMDLDAIIYNSVHNVVRWLRQKINDGERQFRRNFRMIDDAVTIHTRFL